jgi:hypothetical protein
MTPQPLPADFVLGRVSLAWREASWGYDRQWIDWSCLAALAMRYVASEQTSRPEEIELAGMTKNTSVGAGVLAQKLAKDEPDLPEESIRGKWLYVILSWLYANRGRFADPFALVEQIYSDFGYPTELEGFIPYMPPADGYDPRQHSEAENRARLLDLWQEYLASAARQFGGGVPAMPSGNREGETATNS